VRPVPLADLTLRPNALTKFDAVLVAVAGTAPANSLAVSTAALVAAVGLFGPGSILLCAISMFGIAIAFYYLNAWRSDAGASYAWVGRSLHPVLGFMAGWAVLTANVLFMVAGSLPAASATLDLFAPRLANDVLAVTVLGAAWFLFIAVIVLVGIRTTAQFQKIVTGIEIVGVLIIAIAGIVKAGAAHGTAFSATWFSPLGPGTLQAFVAGAIVALFYFWGWDVSANLTEETADRNRAPGVGGLAGMGIILGLFVITQVSIQLTLTPAAIITASSNVLELFANALLPRPWGDIAIIIVIVSTVGTLETCLLAVSRTMMSMGRDRVISTRFAELHPRFATPWFGSIVFAIIALLLFIVAAASPSVTSLLNQSVNAIGIQIAIYYGLSGFACAWYYRTTYAGDPKALWLRGIWPAAASAFLWTVVIVQMVTQVLTVGWQGDALTLGMMVAGFAPLLLYRVKYRPAFYATPMECCQRGEPAGGSQDGAPNETPAGGG
jgi:amino acid transporter